MGRIGLAGTHHAHLSARGVAQSGGAAALGLFGIHHPHSPAVFGAHVPDHDRRPRRRNEGTGAVKLLHLSLRKRSNCEAIRVRGYALMIDRNPSPQPCPDGRGGGPFFAATSSNIDQEVSSMPQTIHRGIKALVDEANAEIETLSAADSIKATQGDDVVIVDIRAPSDTEPDARVPGAFSCTRGMLGFWIAPARPYAKPIFQGDKKFIFHCAGGMRSALAAKTAQDMGLKPVAPMGGGFAAGRDAGGPVEKSEPKKPKG